MTPAPAAPQPPDLLSVLREWGGLLLVPVGGWLLKQLGTIRRKRLRKAELLEALAEVATHYCDEGRFQAEYGPDPRDFEGFLDGEARDRWEHEHGGLGASPREQYESLKTRKRDLRERLWLARGFPPAPHEDDAREVHAQRVEALRQLRQTQRWKAQPPPARTDAKQSAQQGGE
jgi:hypothetical protein